MKLINFTCVEILQSLLSKKKAQTIRKAWLIITREEVDIELKKRLYNLDESYTEIEKEVIKRVPEAYHEYKRRRDDIIKATYKEFDYINLVDKPAKYSVGEKVELVWDEDSEYEWFFKKNGEPLQFTGGHEEDKIFHKNLCTVEITEVFQIGMAKLSTSYIYIEFPENNKSYLDKSCKEEDLAKKDGFKSAEDMFKWFDKHYDLSTPKKFHVYRWRWL